MPTTPVYQLPYPATADPADVPIDLQELAETIENRIGAHIGASPPASPVNGMLWICLPVNYTVGATGLSGGAQVYVYDAAEGSTAKWKFIGGSPFLSQGDGASAPFSCPQNTWVTPATDVSLDLPRQGDYVFDFGASLWPSAAACTAFVGLKVGASEPNVDNWRSIGGYHPVSSARASYKRLAYEGGVAAGAHLSLRYQQSAPTQNMVRSGAYIAAWPVKVG